MKLNLSNPFYIYIYSFLIVFITYTLGWSNLYPNLSLELIFFFILTFLVSYIIGKLSVLNKKLKFSNIKYDNKIYLVTLFIYIGYIIEFIYVGNIPFISIIFGKNYNYTTFGIPVFHVLLVTFSSFYTIYVFHIFISTYKFKIFLFYLLNLSLSLLIYNRAMFLYLITSSIFIILLKHAKNINIRLIIKLIILVLVVLLIFGILGNIRTNSIINRNSLFSTEIILNTFEATSGFKNSIIPKPYFWSYLYISSPLANLQKNINEYSRNKKFSDFVSFINFELLPDFISKRIKKTLNLTPKNELLIHNNLVVSTYYSGAYIYLGWYGIIFMFFYTIAFIYIYILIIKQNKYFVTGLVILNTIILFNIFSNMFTFSGLSFQLIYPIILSLRFKI